MIKNRIYGYKRSVGGGINKMAYEIRRKISSDIKYIKNIVNEIIIEINDSLNSCQKFNARLILSELLINSVKHGNNSDINKYVYISVMIDDNLLKIQVSDEGKGFNFNRKNYNPNNYSSSGRGLLIVEGLSNELMIKGNTVTVITYL